MPTPSLPRDRAGQVRVLGVLALLKLALLAAIVAGAYGRPWLVVVALAVGIAAELIAQLWLPAVDQVLDHARLGPPARLGLAMIAVTATAARCCPTAVFEGAAATAFVVVAAVGTRIGLIKLLSVARPSLEVRPAGTGATRDQPSTITGCVAATIGIIAAIGVAVTGRGHGTAAAAIGLAVATALALARVLSVGSRVLGAARPGARATAVQAANQAVAALAPEVVIYFDATPEEIYQVLQWVEPVRRLGRPAAIILRSQEIFDRLGAQPLPMICTPYNGTIASLPLPDKVVALFVTHTGNNLAMIRRPEARTVFVGHGDSDKPDSVNRFARVYDEVWVAGPLGRRRYAEAGAGVRDEGIVEIGRPQVTPGEGDVADPPVIVYAPTWEGWGDDPHHSSLAQVGPALVARLVRQGSQVRYRPHPLTGNRSPAMRVANAAIRAMTGSVEVVPGAESLEQTLAGASGLVADVSSVISEWLAFDRPYAVADTRGLGVDAFHTRFPTTAGGFVLGLDLDGLDEFLTAARAGTDSTAAARRALVLDALGDPATSQPRFAAAIERLLAS